MANPFDDLIPPPAAPAAPAGNPFDDLVPAPAAAAPPPAPPVQVAPVSAPPVAAQPNPFDDIVPSPAAAAPAAPQGNPFDDLAAQPEDRGFLGGVADFVRSPRRLGALAARTALPIGGALAAGPLGGAAGGLAGEALAQTIEGRDKLNPKAILAQGVLGGIPLASFAKLTGAGRIAAEAAQGAGFGLGATTINSLAEKGELPSASEAVVGTGLGGLLGAGAGALATAGDKAVPGAAGASRVGKAASPTLDDLAARGAPKAAEAARPAAGIADDAARVADLGLASPDLDQAIQKFTANPEKLDPKLSQTLSANFAIDPTDEASVANVIGNVGKAMFSRRTAQERGVVSDEALVGLAREQLEAHGVDFLASAKAGQAFNAEQTVGSLAIVKASADDAFSAIRAAAGGDEASKAAAVEKLVKLGALTEKLSGARAEAGRALRVYGAFKNIQGDLSETAGKLLSRYGGKDQVSDQLLDLMSKLQPGDTAAVTRMAKNAFIPTFADKTFEVWINGLLSGPITHAANFTSNAIVAIEKPFTRTVAAGVDAARSLATGAPRTKFVGDVYYDVVGMMHGLSEGIRPALEAIREQGLEGSLKSESRRAITNETPLLGVLGDRFGRAARFPSRILEASDAFFKAINYSSELYSGAARLARQEGLKGSDLSMRVREIVANPGAFEKIHQRALQESAYRTFTEPLQARWERSLARLRIDTPGVRWFVPFLRTPVNIAKFGINHTPVGLYTAYRKYAAGITTAEKFTDDMAQALIGSTVTMGTVALASQGYITGNGPTDPGKRASLRAAGWSPYSVKVGDKYYSYGRVEPLGTVMGMAANAYELIEHLDSDSPGKLALAFASNLASKTFLSGISDMISAIHDPSIYGDRWFATLAGSAVPNFVSQIAKTEGGEVRAPKGALQQIESRIPGIESYVPILRDIFGAPVIRPGTSAERAFSPVVRQEISSDPVRQEVGRLVTAVDDFGIRGPREDLILAKVKISFTDPEYDRYAELRGSIAHDGLAKVMRSPGYARAIDLDKATIVRSVFERAGTVARAEIFREFPDTRGRLLSELTKVKDQRKAARSQ